MEESFKYNLALKNQLLIQKMTQKSLAERAAINCTSLSRIITGRMNPTEDETRRISEVLGVPVEELFGNQKV
uniref:Putative DNA binding, helix-turn-helix domain containing protein n=1 Tax=viral metagenome TaxID=1070528 RepID=A0A6H1ZR80_9ZZZZ